MNVALSPDEIARACADAMWKEDDASNGLGMKIVEVKPGQATLTMTVAPHMVNGQRIAHGGFIFLLADSTFAFACKGGMCSTCRAKLVEGDALMEVNYSLEPWELKAGFILTCQARPCSDKVVVDYDHV